MTTLKDIAIAAGVKKSTASLVLNDKQGAVRVSDMTRRRIKDAARELNYHPNAAAQALATQRSGHLGFLLSDTVPDGWMNAYYAQFLDGAEVACREHGYGLTVSRSNLSNVDSFVFPARVGQRSVDGLLLSGYIQHAVLLRFQEFGIPCICLGESLELPDDAPVLSTETTEGMCLLIKHALKQGHRRIGLCLGDTRHARNKARKIIDRLAVDKDAPRWQPIVMEPKGAIFDYSMGQPLFEQWRAMPADRRPTLMIASDQILLGFLQALHQAGMRCPEDVSLISGCDTRLCEYASPALTALRVDRKQLSSLAVQWMVDHLEKGADLALAAKKENTMGKLVERESVKNLSTEHHGGDEFMDIAKQVQATYGHQPVNNEMSWVLEKSDKKGGYK